MSAAPCLIRHPGDDHLARKRSLAQCWVVRAADYDSALELVNSHEFGNGSAVFTSNSHTARGIRPDVQAGMVGVNDAGPRCRWRSQLRRLEALGVWRVERPRAGRRALLHAYEDRHRTLASRGSRPYLNSACRR